MQGNYKTATAAFKLMTNIGTKRGRRHLLLNTGLVKTKPCIPLTAIGGKHQSIVLFNHFIHCL